MQTQLKFSLRLLPIILSFFMIFGMMQVERYFYPVMQDFKFTKMYRHLNTIEIEGIYIPKRSCTMVGGRFIGYDHTGNFSIIQMTQISTTTGKYIGPGVAEIGAWQVEYIAEVVMKNIYFMGFFKCHPFWVTEYKIAEFRAPPTIYDVNGLLKESEINRNLLLDDLSL